MKTYDVVNKENYQEVLDEIKKDLTDTFVGEKVKSIKYGDGTIKEITDIIFYGRHADTPIGITSQIAFGEEIKSFYLNVAIKTTFIVLYNNELKEVMKNTMTELEKVAEVVYQIRIEEMEKEAEVQKLIKEAELKAKKEAEAQQKLQQKRDKIIHDLNQIKTTISDNNDFYTDLGWIAKHVGSISAAIPDYLENWFVHRFGSEAPKRVVNSKRKTVGGYSMQWSAGFAISFKKVKEDDIPASLYSQMKNNKIHNTSLVFDLIENYGFTFGTKQDIDAIRKCIPFNKKEMFELGFAS